MIYVSTGTTCDDCQQVANTVHEVGPVGELGFCDDCFGAYEERNDRAEAEAQDWFARHPEALDKR